MTAADCHARLKAALDAAGSAVDAAASAEDADRAARLLADADARFTDACPQLAPYDQRQLATAIKSLQAKLAQRQAELAPRKKFAFKSRPAPAGTNSQQPDPKQTTPSASAPSDPSPSEPPPSSSASSFVLSNLQDQRLILRPQQPSYDDAADAKSSSSSSSSSLRNSDDVTLSNLTRCIVAWTAHPSGNQAATPSSSPRCLLAVRAQGLRGCTISTGLVSGSVWVEDCHDCTLIVISRQLRIHKTTNTTILALVNSNPIIEESTSLTFARLSPETLAQALGIRVTDAHIVDGLDLASNKWDKVDDFNWLRSTPSPNWRTAIPDDGETREIESRLLAVYNETSSG